MEKITIKPTKKEIKPTKKERLNTLENQGIIKLGEKRKCLQQTKQHK